MDEDARLLRDSEAAFAVAAFKSKWSRITSSSVVTAHLAFTTQVFGDASVIIVSDYFPDSITLRDKHSPSHTRPPSRGLGVQIPEQVLWNYTVQIANALKSIHSRGLAARLMDAKRWLVTDEDRIQFNACGLADVTDPTTLALRDQQSNDLHEFGKLIFTLGTAGSHKMRPVDHFARVYSPRLKSAVEWLQQQTMPLNGTGSIDDFLEIIANDAIDAFDASLNLNDSLQATLSRELESSRIARLLFKLNAINDRPEYENDLAWRDQGQRAALKLFRDYVFHQVDGNGNPVLDMGHMLACCNKLDVGVDERIALTTRDERNVVVVSYREMKNAVEVAWGELMRRSAV